MPKVLRNTSEFIPTTWINTANSNVLYGASLNEVTKTIALLLGVAVSLLGLSANKLKSKS